MTFESLWPWKSRRSWWPWGSNDPVSAAVSRHCEDENKYKREHMMPGSYSFSALEVNHKCGFLKILPVCLVRESCRDADLSLKWFLVFLGFLVALAGLVHLSRTHKSQLLCWHRLTTNHTIGNLKITNV